TEKGGYGNVFAAFAPDNTTAWVSTPDGRLLVIDLAAGKVVGTVDTERLPVSAAPAFSPDGKTVAVGVGNPYSSDGVVRLYDVGTRQAGRTFRGHAGVVLCTAFSPDGKR